MIEQTTVHGSIFFLLRKFVGANLPEGSWERIISQADFDEATLELTQAYPIEKIAAIITAASEATGLSVETLKEQFGEYMVPDLFHMYRHYLQPKWATYEVLVNTEEVMHGAVRKLNSSAHPPILSVSQVSDTLLIVDYYSKRRMGSLAVGIIKGIARHFNEEGDVKVISKTNPDAERVQIRVEFSSRRVPSS